MENLEKSVEKRIFELEKKEEKIEKTQIFGILSGGAIGILGWAGFFGSALCGAYNIIPETLAMKIMHIGLYSGIFGLASAIMFNTTPYDMLQEMGWKIENLRKSPAQ